MRRTLLVLGIAALIVVGCKKDESAGGVGPLAKSKTRVLVVDDHPLVRVGIAMVLNRQKDMLCCGEAETLSEVLPAVRTHNPELVLLDLYLKKDNSLAIIAPVRAQFPSVRVLVLSQCEEGIYAEQSLRAGASGYVMKEQAPDTVVDAIRTVMSGQLYVSDKLVGRLLLKLLDGNTAHSWIKQEPLSGETKIKIQNSTANTQGRCES